MGKCSLYLITAVAFLAWGCQDSLSVEEFTNGGNKPTPKSECVDGISSGKYPCSHIDLLAELSPADLEGEKLNDIWGWTDPVTSKEYALVGLTDGVTFVDISDPAEPVVLGKLGEHTGSSGSVSGEAIYSDEEKSTWRDFKEYKNHLYVVSDGQPHGMQIFDLTQLRSVDNPPADFTEDGHYGDFDHAHNIAINKESGFAYVVGSDTYGGGLHIIDINDPLNPAFAGSHADTAVGRAGTGYIHDTQCVTYKGADSDYSGDEICFNSSETHLMIANVTDKDSVYTISRKTYSGAEYVHQGWLTEDHNYFFLDDELDESRNNHAVKTYIWDVTDLDQPGMINVYESSTRSIDHNQYVKDSFVYQANYTSGLRILKIEDITTGTLREVGYFDTFPISENAEFDGAWSNYPFFDGGVIAVSDISNGLFLLKLSTE